MEYDGVPETLVERGPRGSCRPKTGSWSSVSRTSPPPGSRRTTIRSTRRRSASRSPLPRTSRSSPTGSSRARRRRRLDHLGLGRPSRWPRTSRRWRSASSISASTRSTPCRSGTRSTPRRSSRLGPRGRQPVRPLAVGELVVQAAHADDRRPRRWRDPFVLVDRSTEEFWDFFFVEATRPVRTIGRPCPTWSQHQVTPLVRAGGAPVPPALPDVRRRVPAVRCGDHRRVVGEQRVQRRLRGVDRRSVGLGR